MHEKTKGLLASAAFKFLIDGRQSENLVLRPQKTKEDNWNFFEKPLLSRVNPFDPVTQPNWIPTIQKMMGTTDPFPFSMGVSQLADMNTNGRPVSNSRVKTPYSLRF